MGDFLWKKGESSLRYFTSSKCVSFFSENHLNGDDATEECEDSESDDQRYPVVENDTVE